MQSPPPQKEMMSMLAPTYIIALLEFIFLIVAYRFQLSVMDDL